MNFVTDTFESIHRRKKLAAWLATLRGPRGEKPVMVVRLKQIELYDMRHMPPRYKLIFRQ